MCMPNRFVPVLVLVLVSSPTFGLAAQDRFPVQRLTFDPAQEGFPSWSPDGATIVYSYLERRDSGIVAGLHTIPSAGGEPRWLTDEIGEHPSWSREGHYIVFDAEMGESIKLTSARGGPPVRIVPSSIPVQSGGNPIWSPDGSRILFKSGTDLWVLDIGTGDAQPIFTREGTKAIPGCWADDGASVYFTLADADGFRGRSILETRVDGDEYRVVLPESEYSYRYMDLSPDGSLLVFVQCEGRNCDLWVLPAGGGSAVQLTRHPAYDDTPRWSPDGTRIAFTSARANNFDVWVMTLDLTALRAALDSAATEGGRVGGR
jgi:Tol biopolymer transport system component